ncbi:spore coat putative kinase YutH [Halalkalibacter nanhaiisediminis]|uniref:Spore coat protein YutH n=1 Tax=Halalkalibacter nanhaiisediminis TaxID=688079 RepID=A0A562QU11_9BACI|nr:spore coat protein YutH [Halalkalibacter nanhaiisediminis]TWI60103.1 spore coat protein YutH [Halalkalibacter nanhaiisediminis]
MFERNLYDIYGLYCESRFALGDYESFQAGGQSYILLPKEELSSSEQEMMAFADYLHSVGDSSVLRPMMTLHKQPSGLIDGQNVYVCPLPNDMRYGQTRIEHGAEKGKHLAMIHYYGTQMPYEKRKYDFFGQWHKLWETRLEQLEGWYQQILYESPQSYVDEAFLFSYPYYMGLTENAIQYVVDAMLDDPGRAEEKPTICHRRFTDKTWLVLSEQGEIVKRPTEFIYDHPCRDLAEWIREYQLNEKSFSWQDIDLFLREYEQYEPLTTFSWRLLYARLLFPLHYFETIEHYYRSQVKEEKVEAGQAFFRLLKQEKQNERFLKEFAVGVLSSKAIAPNQIPPVEWL